MEDGFMFLSELKDEQKELFLDLGIHLSMSDGEFSNSEKNTIHQMCKEMGIDERLEENVEFNVALSRLYKNATVREKRIVLLEIAGIVMADSVYSPEEKAVVEKISSALGVDYSHCEEVISLIKDLYAVYSKIGDFLSSK